MTPKCLQHPDIPAAWEVTMYERPKTMLWRTTVCEECLEINKPVMKLNGPRFLLLLWKLS